MRKRSLFPTTLLVTLAVCSISVAAGGDPVYFAQLGAGFLGDTAFRTEFRFLNEQPNEVRGALTFLTSRGEPMEPEISALWIPEQGVLFQESNRVDFEIPAGASLQLTLVPGPTRSIGYARLETEGDCHVQAFFQFSRFDPETMLLFEEGLIREVEIFPTEPVNAAGFLASFLQGQQTLNTGIAVVNLSGVAATAKLVRRPEEAFPITLAPGEVFSGFFSEIVPPRLTQVMPFERDALIRVTSPVPLGIAVIRTLEGFPLSGVRIAEAPGDDETFSGQLGEEVVLPLGQTVRFAEDGFEVTFWNVTEDSRCPIGVTCVWEGRVRVVVRARRNGTDLGEAELMLPGGGEGPTDEVRLGEFRVELRSVDPYPVADPDLEQNPPPDYTITLVVTRAEP